MFDQRLKEMRVGVEVIIVEVAQLSRRAAVSFRRTTVIAMQGVGEIEAGEIVELVQKFGVGFGVKFAA